MVSLHRKTDANLVNFSLSNHHIYKKIVMLRIAIDMDDVLADSALKAVEAFNKEHGFGPSKEEIQGKHLRETVSAEYGDKIVSYFFKRGFLRDVPVIEHSQEVVKKLYEKHEVFIVSAAMEMPYSLEDKFFWLEEHFPFIHWQRIVFCGDKSIINADILIDDRSHNFRNFNGRPLLFTAHHNTTLEGFERVNTWKEVESLLLLD